MFVVSEKWWSKDSLLYDENINPTWYHNHYVSVIGSFVESNILCRVQKLFFFSFFFFFFFFFCFVISKRKKNCSFCQLFSSWEVMSDFACYLLVPSSIANWHLSPWWTYSHDIWVYTWIMIKLNLLSCNIVYVDCSAF